jgi:DNA polymerase phi
MDDDQMMAIEPQLTKIFQQRQAASATNKRKEQHDAKENMVNFKSRVLDLLGIFLKQEHKNSLVFNVILPLLQLMRRTSSQLVANKASDILKAFVDACHKNKSHPVLVDIDQAWLLLREIHGEAKQQASKQHDITCSRASLLIVRSLVNVDQANYRKASSIYAETQADWFADRKVNMEPKFFTEWVSWSAEMRKRA